MTEPREMMDERMMDIMKVMQNYQPDTVEYKKCVEALTSIAKVRNDALKIECDYEQVAEKTSTEDATRLIEQEEDKRRFLINTILRGAEIGLSILLFAGMCIAESKGTFTNMSTKNLFNGMRFGIKK